MTKSFGSQMLAACSLSLILTAYALITEEPLSWEFALADPPTTGGEPLFKTVFDYVSSPASAHSPSIRVFEDHVQLVWFEGTREGHEDVVIKNKQQVFKPANLKLGDDFEEVVYDDKRKSKEGFRVSQRDGDASDEESR